MELWPWKAKRKWLMMRPTEGLQDNQRLDQMWADGWWFWTLKIDVLERTIGHRSLRYQNYEQH